MFKATQPGPGRKISIRSLFVCGNCFFYAHRMKSFALVWGRGLVTFCGFACGWRLTQTFNCVCFVWAGVSSSAARLPGLVLRDAWRSLWAPSVLSGEGLQKCKPTRGVGLIQRAALLLKHYTQNLPGKDTTFCMTWVEWTMIFEWTQFQYDCVKGIFEIFFTYFYPPSMLPMNSMSG